MRGCLGGVAIGLAAASFFLPASASAQAVGRTNTVSAHAWYYGVGHFQLSPHWGLSAEAHLRRASLLADKQQLLVRTSANYSLNERVMLTVGYGYIETYPYGEYPSVTAFPEHRLFQQMQLTAPPLGRLGLTHRYRLEQRFIQFPERSAAQLLNRVRYQLRATRPFAKAGAAPSTLYGYFFDEVFVGFGRNVAANIFDQNRLGAGLGYKLSKAMTVEAGYMQQLVAQRNGKVFEYNNTFTFALISNLDVQRGASAATGPPAAQ